MNISLRNLEILGMTLGLQIRDRNIFNWNLVKELDRHDRITMLLFQKLFGGRKEGFIG